MSECEICLKHRQLERVPGGDILSDAHAVVTHLVPEGEPVYLGYLFVEPRRHVADLGGLRPGEAASVGLLAARAAEALQRAAGAEHVYAAVIGHGRDHFHLHLVARYPGTPRQYWWTRVDEWPDAPRGGAGEVAAFAERLRAAIGG